MQALSAQELIEQNNRATDYVVGTPGPVNGDIAEYVLHNTEVIAWSLSRDQFVKLGSPAVNALQDAAASARELAPLGEEDLAKRPNDSDEQHEFRTSIQLPLR